MSCSRSSKSKVSIAKYDHVIIINHMCTVIQKKDKDINKQTNQKTSVCTINININNTEKSVQFMLYNK